MSRLGEILISEGLISHEQLAEALESQSKGGGRLGSCLVRLGAITEDALTSMLSKQYGVPCINLSNFEIEPEIANLLNRVVATKFQVLPLSRMGSTLTIAMADPINVTALDELKFMTGLSIQPLIAPESQLMQAIEKHFGAMYDTQLKQVFEDLTDSSADVAGVEVIDV